MLGVGSCFASTRAAWRAAPLAERVLLLTVLIAGTWLRLAYRDLNFFNIDESIEAMLQLRLVRGEVLPLAGPEMASDNAGPLTGPFFYYFLAIPYWLFGDPVAALAFMNVVGMLAVFLTWQLGNEVFGRPVGIVAATLYAFFPLVVLNSGPQLSSMPFFSLILLLALTRYVRERQPWMLSWTLFLLGIALQIYPGMLVFVAVVAGAIALYRPPIRPWPLVVGCLAAALPYVPLVIFELLRDFEGFRRFFHWAEGALAGAQAGPSQAYLTILGRALLSPFSLPPEMAAALPQAAPWSEGFALLQWFEFALFVGALAFLLLGLRRTEQRRAHALLLLWLAFPYLVFSLNKVGTYWYTLESAFPAHFLVIGLMARAAWRTRARLRRWSRLTVGGLTVGVALGQGLSLVTYREAQARAGVIRFPQSALLTFPDLLWRFPLDHYEFLTARHVRGLTHALKTQLGLSQEAADARVHGRIYEQLRDVADFYWETLPASARAAPPENLHHVILDAPRTPGAGASFSADVPPFRIVSYTPAIDGDAWRMRTDPADGATEGQSRETTWRPVRLPLRDAIKKRHRVGVGVKTFTLRGHLRHTPTALHRLVVVSVRMVADVSHRPAPPGWRATLHVNDREAEPLYRRGAMTIWPYEESWYDVAALLREGDNELTLSLTGLDADFSLDVYEVGVAEARATRRRGE